MSLQIKAVGKTDVGLVRPGNEDYLHLDPDHHVYAVCDGMGGHNAGEVASEMAAHTIGNVFANYANKLGDDTHLSIGRTLPPKGELLLQAIRLANRAIYNRAAQDPDQSGMGTTIVAVALEADIMSVAHVGDSRAYLLRERDLLPLTRDHSWIAEIQQTQKLSPEEAGSFVGKNVITRALGVRDTVEVDCRIIKVKAGDKFIMCSDGLCGFADDDEIFDVASKFRDNLEDLTKALVQMANDRGGSDNVTIIALEIIEVKESPLPDLDVFTLGAESDATLAAEDIWLERMAEQAELSVKPESGARVINKYALLAIFLVFVIVAVLIVWYMPNN